MSREWSGGSDTRWRRFRLTILTRDNNLCTLHEQGCTTNATEVHHIIPLSRGGAKYDPANCAAACKPCNLRLGDSTPAPQPTPQPTTTW